MFLPSLTRVALDFSSVKKESKKVDTVSHKMHCISIAQISLYRMTVCFEKQTELEHSLQSCSGGVRKYKVVVCTHRFCYYSPVISKLGGQ